jgi:hypothetical protein
MSFNTWLKEVDSVAQDPRVWAYPTRDIDTFDPQDRTAAVVALVHRARAGDAKAIEALGAQELQLGEAELADAIAALEYAQLHANGWGRAAATRILARKRGGGEPGALALTENPLLRGLGAYELKQHPDPATIPILIGLLMDPDTIVRVHASEGIIAKLGLARLNTALGSPVNRIDSGCAARFETIWRPACTELRDIAEAIILGADPASLGLVFVPSDDPELTRTFFLNASKWQPHDTALIRRMGRHDRRWAESVLLGRLEFPELHAVDALVDLDVAGWRPVMAEAVAEFAARGNQPEFVARARAALAV